MVYFCAYSDEMSTCPFYDWNWNIFLNILIIIKWSLIGITYQKLDVGLLLRHGGDNIGDDKSDSESNDVESERERNRDGDNVFGGVKFNLLKLLRLISKSNDLKPFQLESSYGIILLQHDLAMLLQQQ